MNAHTFLEKRCLLADDSSPIGTAMANRAGRIIPIRSIVSFMLAICHHSLEITLLSFRNSTVNRHPLVGLRTRWTWDQAVALDVCMTCRSSKSSIIWLSAACFSTEIWREDNRFAGASHSLLVTIKVMGLRT